MEAEQVALEGAAVWHAAIDEPLHPVGAVPHLAIADQGDKQ
jgi:hypothetical protein